MRVFKIRNKGTGEFASGGVRPVWSKNGKRWDEAAHVKGHYRAVRQFWERYDIKKYEDYVRNTEVIEYEIVEAKTVDATTLVES